MVKKPKKEGSIGIIQRDIGDVKIRIKFTIRKKTLWIITVEGDEEKGSSIRNARSRQQLVAL